MTKRTDRHARRKTPRAAILHLAQQLQKEALRTGSVGDLEVADLVTAAWLLDGRPGETGSKLAHAARAYLATVDRTDVCERATPQRVERPSAWLASLRAHATRQLGVLDMAKDVDDRRWACRVVAGAMISFAIGSVPGIDARPPLDPFGRLLRQLDERGPSDAVELARWTLAALGMSGTAINRAENGARVQKSRSPDQRDKRARARKRSA